MTQITSKNFEYAFDRWPAGIDLAAICKEMGRRVDALDQEMRDLLHATVNDLATHIDLMFAPTHYAMGIKTEIPKPLSDAYQHIRNAGRDLEPDLVRDSDITACQCWLRPPIAPKGRKARSA